MADVSGGVVKWIVDADTSRFDAGLDKASTEANAFGNHLTKTGARAASNFSRDLGSAFDSIGSGLGRLVKGFAIAGTAGSVGFGSMIKAAIDQQRSVENARFALRAYEGDASKVNSVLSDLVKFATSPLGTLFQREELFKAASNLKVFGDDTAKLTDHIKIMSRAVALGFTNFDELSQILGRVGAAGKLTGVDFDVLTARGIKLPDTMRNAAVSFDDLFKAVSNAIPEGVLEGRADSIDGRLIRLKSSFRNLGSAILGINRDTNEFTEGGLGDRMLKLLDSLRETLGSPEIKTAFTELGKSVAAFAERALPLLISGISFIARNVDTIAPAFVALAAAWATASIAGAILGAVFLAISSPAYLVAAAITAIVGVITFLQLKFNIFGETLEFIGSIAQKVGDTLSKAFREFKDMVSDLVDNTLRFFKDRIDEITAAFERVLGWVKDVTEAYKNNEGNLKIIANTITVLVLPALGKLAAESAITAVKVAAAGVAASAGWVASKATELWGWISSLAKLIVESGISAAKVAAKGVIATGGWIASGVAQLWGWVSSLAALVIEAGRRAPVIAAKGAIAAAGWIATGWGWAVHLADIAAAAAFNAARIAFQGSIAAVGWTVGAAKASVAWVVTELPRIVAAAAITAAQSSIHASQTAAAWVLNAAKVSAVWVITELPKIITAFITTSASAIIHAGVASVAWVASATKSAVAWVITELPRIIAAFVLTSGSAVVNAAIASGAWVKSATTSTASFQAFKALVTTPLVMPAIVIVAALASLIEVYKAVQSITGAIRDVNNAARAASSNNDEQIRSLQKQAAAARAIGDTVAVNRISNAIRALGYAKGTNFAPGGMALVGERGPELVNLPRGSQVVPNHELWPALAPNVMGDSSKDYGTVVNNYIETINIGSEVEGENWLQKLTRDQEIVSRGLTPGANNATN